MHPNKRIQKRQHVKVKAIIIDTAGKILGRCMVVNVSASGAKLTLPVATETPIEFDLVLTRDGAVRRHCEVAWRSGNDIGVMFSS